MGKAGRFARDVFFWSFQRGTLPYDILCGLILAFIIFVPRSCFAPKPKPGQDVSHEQQDARSPAPPAVSGNIPQQGK